MPKKDIEYEIRIKSLTSRLRHRRRVSFLVRFG